MQNGSETKADPDVRDFPNLNVPKPVQPSAADEVFHGTTRKHNKTTHSCSGAKNGVLVADVEREAPSRERHPQYVP